VKKRDIEFEKAVGTKVRELRGRLGWSQKQLADIANIEQNQVQRVENAKNTTTLAILTAIAKALGQQPFELLRTEHQVRVNTNFDVLARRKSPETTKHIHKIVKSSFLNSPRSVNDIVKYCKDRFNVKMPSSATSGILKTLVDNKILKRTPANIKGRFLYQKR
jgi:transcriptional regulator with XRE-family HTH domain